MRPDAQIKQEAEQALRRDPQLEAADIAVAVDHGVVLLTGFARNAEEKWLAARDVARVSGVAAVANDIAVPRQARSDAQLARQVADEMRWALPYAHRFVRPLLRNGWLTLEGAVQWSYQKERAESTALRVSGLSGVTSALRVERRIEPAEIRNALAAAFTTAGRRR